MRNMLKPNKSKPIKRKILKFPRFRTRKARTPLKQRIVMGALRWGNKFAEGRVTTHASNFADKHIVKKRV